MLNKRFANHIIKATTVSDSFIMAVIPKLQDRSVAMVRSKLQQLRKVCIRGHKQSVSAIYPHTNLHSHLPNDFRIYFFTLNKF